MKNKERIRNHRKWTKKKEKRRKIQRQANKKRNPKKQKKKFMCIKNQKTNGKNNKTFKP